MTDETSTVVDDTATTDDAQAVEQVVTESAEENTWQFADGINGEGEKPEWFKDSKYKTVAEQAKAYTELEGRFGSFTGAPEEYEITLDEALTEQGIEIDNDDPLMEEAFKFAKESNMSQEGFNSMINMYAMAKVAENKAMEEQQQEEIKALGPTGEKRIANLAAWGQKNLSPELFAGFEDMLTTSASIQAAEKMIAMTRGAVINPESANNAPSVSSEEVRQMQFEKDEHGNRRIQTDPDFKRRYEKMRDEVWGSEEHRVIVG